MLRLLRAYSRRGEYLLNVVDNGFSTCRAYEAGRERLKYAHFRAEQAVEAAALDSFSRPRARRIAIRVDVGAEVTVEADPLRSCSGSPPRSCATR